MSSPLFSPTLQGRKTEEGWLVYKEDELGIGDEGGGKLVCVFCFLLFTAFQTLRYVPLIVNAVRCVSLNIPCLIKV